MVQAIVKVQKNKNITLPTWVMRRFKVSPGDFLQLKETPQGILIRPVRWITNSRKPGSSKKIT